MAYEFTTWNKLDQYLVERIFVSHTGREFVKKKKQQTNKLKWSSKDKQNLQLLGTNSTAGCDINVTCLKTV